MSKSYPDIPFGNVRVKDSNKLFWFIKSISGYQNFERSFPYFSILISLIENDEPVAAVVFDPIKGDCFKAEYGGGAFVNNRNRLRVSSRRNLNNATIALDIPYNLESILVQNNAIIRRIGDVSMDLAYLASGKFDACISIDKTLLELSAGILLVKESGGFTEIQKTKDGLFNLIATSSIEMMRKLLSFYNIM